MYAWRKIIKELKPIAIDMIFVLFDDLRNDNPGLGVEALGSSANVLIGLFALIRFDQNSK